MTNKEYRLSQLKYQLENKKSKGQKSVIWKLGREQKEFLDQFYRITPFIYEVKTRTFKNPSNLPAILKKLHHAKINRKTKVYLPLKNQDLATLHEFDVPYTVCKYKIYLQ